MYPTFEYWLLIPKVVEIILFVILATKMYRLSEYILNRILSAAFIIWALYIVCDSIVWISAANSRPWYDISQAIRDISMVLAITMSLLMFFSAQIIKDGEKSLNSWKTIMISIILIIFAVFLNINDELVVINSQGTKLDPSTFPVNEPVQVVYQITPWLILSSVIPFAVYIISIVKLSQLAINVKDQKSKQKMWLMVAGIAMIPLGMIYFVVLGLFTTTTFVTSSIGHVIWMLAPFLMVRSQLN
jgi:hypothetical protein